MNLLDAAEGRARQAIEPATGQGSQFRDMILILDGKLVVAEGPILKVYQG